MILEIIGYIASVILAISLMMNSIIRLRWINFVGSTIFSLYGFLIHSFPVALLNGFLALTNIYHLYKIYKSEDYFKILEFTNNSKYIRYFFNFYKKEITKYIPDYDFVIKDTDFGFYILRNLVPAGVFVGEKKDNEVFLIKLDFVIPDFRDFKIGKYLFEKKRDFFLEKGIKTLICYEVNESHVKYLLKMGFYPIKDEKGNTVFTFDLLSN